MAQLADFLLPVEDRDCTIVLQLVGDVPSAAAVPATDNASGSGAGTDTEAGSAGGDNEAEEQQATRDKGKQHRRGKACTEEPTSKRNKRDSAAAHGRLPACSVVLKLFSPKYRDWAARWAEGGSAAAKEYVVQCRDEAEVSGMHLLLHFMHSMGKDLPIDPDELLQLLLAAREHAVEAAVLACTQRLLDQVLTLGASPCMRLLSVLATGASGDDRIQAAADQLTSACHRKLCQLLAQPREEGNPWAAHEVEQLVHLLGPLQDMLNDQQLRELWCCLGFEVLRDCMLDDAHVNADTETTVLAACLHWLEAPQRQPQAFDVAEIFSKIRFPAIPASILVDLHGSFPSLQRFDPNKELLLRAVSSAAEPGIWDDLRDAVAAPSPAPGILLLKKQCERWWLPRPAPQLPRCPAPAEFRFQCKKSAGKDTVSADSFYWGGHFWYVDIQGQANGTTGIFLNTSKDLARVPTFESIDYDGLTPASYSTKVAYSISLGTVQRGDEVQARCVNKFSLGHGGWGCLELVDKSSEDKTPLSWDALWAEGASPFCKDGAVVGRVTLSAQGS